MATLVFDNTGEEVELPDGSPIAKACEEAGVPFACEEGVCGTCVIQVLEGELSPPTQEEEDFLGEGTKHERLACQCRMSSNRVRVSF
jgi:ferredoxin